MEIASISLSLLALIVAGASFYVAWRSSKRQAEAHDVQWRVSLVGPNIVRLTNLGLHTAHHVEARVQAFGSNYLVKGPSVAGGSTRDHEDDRLTLHMFATLPKGGIRVAQLPDLQWTVVWKSSTGMGHKLTGSSPIL
ncbi:hypothetical protein [Chryseoglobus sp. 28M-23]|uniref:hypothetical protein n=1 Tax=Chryseoglobus sp. 28M-23 TaxID=2772253 RepID=UPI0017474373|nr:hypothetical protein [Chryseoglobus sp. 28M-23]QOD93475.1 hypothetical protein IE160_11310 [Chryseoglobus sp. 28M-23]